MLVEGNSLRAVSRMADVSINTVTKLLVNVGTACAAYLDANLVNLRCQRVQVDEIWAFCYAKQKNVTQEMAEARIAGDVWTFVSIEAQTKLVINWMVGQRDAGFATEFLQDLRNRLKTRVQLTTDGHKMYLTAVADTFDQNEVDYAQIVKIYGNDVEGQKRYSPAVCTGCKKHEIVGNPDPEHISTSYIERQNPTMRMGMRRFSRLTNGFSKKLENHRHSVALHCLHYNFARIHKTLRVTPAMEAGISDRVWSLEDIAGLAS
jgi:IS1 family transposase